jgi:hypothetical protein
MKISFFTIYLALFSSLAHSYEISSDKLTLLKDPNVHLSLIGMNQNYDSIFAELSLYEKQSDGSILVPYVGQDKNGKSLGGFGWMRLSCNDEKNIDFGAYANGKFEREVVAKEGSLTFQARQFYCAIPSDINSRILAYNARKNSDNKSYSMWGWEIDSLKVDTNDTNVILSTVYSFVMKDKKAITSNPHPFAVNCKNKSITSIKDNKTFNTNTSEGLPSRIIVDTICKFNDIQNMNGIKNND